MGSIHHQAGVQHLALHRQDDSVPPAVVLVQHQHQVALAAVQALEQERLEQVHPQPAQDLDQHQL